MVCGPAGTSDCCASPLVPAATYFRSADVGTDNEYTDMSAPATVSDFRLDKYEITVARFRQFVTAGGRHAAEAAGRRQWCASVDCRQRLGRASWNTSLDARYGCADRGRQLRMRHPQTWDRRTGCEREPADQLSGTGSRRWRSVRGTAAFSRARPSGITPRPLLAPSSARFRSRIRRSFADPRLHAGKIYNPGTECVDAPIGFTRSRRQPVSDRRREMGPRGSRGQRRRVGARLGGCLPVVPCTDCA